MAFQNPIDLLLDAADTLQSVPPPDALVKLKATFFLNNEIPLDVKFKSLRVKDFLSLTFIHYICMVCKDTDLPTFVQLFTHCFEIADQYAANNPDENPVKTRLQLNLLSSTGQNVLHLLAQQRKPHLIDALLKLLLERDQTHLIKPLSTDKVGRTFMDLLLHWNKGDEALAIVNKYEHYFGFAEAKKALTQKLYLLKEKESVIKQKSKEETKVQIPHLEPPLARLESLSATPIDKVSLDVANDPVQEIRRQMFKEGSINGRLIQNLVSLSKDSLKHLTLQPLNLTLMSELLNASPAAFINQGRNLLKAIQQFFIRHYSVEDFKGYVKASPSHRDYPFYMEAVRSHSHDVIQACLALEDIVDFEWNALDKRQNTVFHLLLMNAKLNNRERLSLIEIFLEKVYSLATSLNIEGFTPYVLALQCFGEQSDNHGVKIVRTLEGLENFELYKQDLIIQNTMIMNYHSTSKLKLKDVKVLINPLQICVRRGLLTTFKRLVEEQKLPLQWICLNKLSVLELAVEYDHPVEFLQFILDHFSGSYSYYSDLEEEPCVKTFISLKKVLISWCRSNEHNLKFLGVKTYLQSQEEKVELALDSVCGPGTLLLHPLFTQAQQKVLSADRKLQRESSYSLLQKKHFKLNKLADMIFAHDYPLPLKQELYEEVFQQVRATPNTQSSQILIRWLQTYNPPLTKLFPSAPENIDESDQKYYQYWWAMHFLPPARCLKMEVPQSEIFRAALVEYIGSEAYKERAKQLADVNSNDSHMSAAYVGALKICRAHLAVNETEIYDKIVAELIEPERLPYVLEMVLTDIQENTLRLTRFEVQTLVKFNQFKVIEQLTSHFTKIMSTLIREIQDVKQQSCKDSFYDIIYFETMDDKAAFYNGLSQKEQQVMEIDMRLRQFRNSKFTIVIQPGFKYANALMKESAILMALSQSNIKYILNDENITDPEARLVLEVSRLSQDMRVNINHMLVCCRKFLPLYEMHLKLNPLAQRLYYMKCPEAYEIYARYYPYSLPEFTANYDYRENGAHGLNGAVSLFRRIKAEGRDYLLTEKAEDEENQTDPEYALALDFHRLSQLKFDDFKAYLSANQDVKLIPKKLSDFPYQFKDKRESFSYLQILGGRMKLQGSTIDDSDNLLISLNYLMKNFSSGVPPSILTHFLQPSILEKCSHDTLVRMIYAFALHDEIDSVLLILKSRNLKSIKSQLLPTKQKSMTLDTLRLMAVLTSQNKRACFTPLYFKALGVKPEPALSILENLLKDEKYQEITQVALLLKERIKTEVCEPDTFRGLFEAVLHLGRYDFFYDEMINWIAESAQKGELLECAFTILGKLLKKRNNPLRIIYDAKGAIRQFVKEAGSYQDMQSVLREYQELWKAEKKEDVNYVRFEELKKEMIKQKKQKRPRNIKHFNIESLFAFERELPTLISSLASKLQDIKQLSFTLEIAYNELMSSRISEALRTLMTQLTKLKGPQEEKKEQAQEDNIIDVGILIHYTTFVADPGLTHISEHEAAIAALLRHCAGSQISSFCNSYKELPSSVIPEDVLLALVDVSVQNKLPMTDESLKLAIKMNYSLLFSQLLQHVASGCYSPYSLLVECFKHNSLSVLYQILPSVSVQITKAQLTEHHQKIALHIESCCRELSLSLYPLPLLQLSFFINPKLQTVQYLMNNTNPVTERTIQIYCMSGNFDKLIWQALYVKLQEPLSDLVADLIYLAFEQTRMRLLNQLLPLYFDHYPTIVMLEEHIPKSFSCFAHYIVLSGDFEFAMHLREKYSMLLTSRVKEQQGKKECKHPFITALLFKRYEFLDLFPLDPEIPLCQEECEVIRSTTLSSLQISHLVNNNQSKFKTERIERLRQLVSIFQKEGIQLTPPRCALLADVTLFPEKLNLAHLSLVNLSGWNAKGLLHYACLSIVCQMYPIEQLMSLISAHLCSSNQPHIILFILEQMAQLLVDSQTASSDFKPYLLDNFKKTYTHEASVISQIRETLNLPSFDSQLSQTGKECITQFVMRCLTIPDPEPALFKTALLIDYSLGSAHFSNLAHFLLHSSAKCTPMLYSVLIEILVHKSIKPPISLALFNPLLIPRSKNKGSHILVQLPMNGQEEAQPDRIQMAPHNLVLFFLLLRRLGNSILNEQIQAQTCLVSIFDSLLDPAKNSTAYFSVSKIDTFLAKVQKVLKSIESTSEDLAFSDQKLFNLIFQLIRKPDVTLPSGAKNKYKLNLAELGSYSIKNFTDFRSSVKKLLLPIESVRDFFDASLPRAEVPHIKLDVQFSDNKGPLIQTMALHTQENKGIQEWSLKLTINSKDMLTLDILEQRLDSMFYSSDTLLSLLEPILSSKWGTPVEIQKSEFSKDELRLLWEAQLQEKRLNPIDKVRQRLKDQLQPLCGNVADFPYEIQPGPYLSPDEHPYFKLDKGDIKLNQNEEGDFVSRVPPPQLEQIAVERNIDRAFHSIVLTTRSLANLNHQFSSLANPEDRTKLYVSFNPQTKLAQPCLYSHPDGFIMKLLSIVNLKLLEITWEVTKKLDKSPIFLWRSLFQICEFVEPSKPLQYFESVLMEGELCDALTAILLTYESSSIYKGIKHLLFDFQRSPSCKQNQPLRVSNVTYACYRDAIVAKIVLGSESELSVSTLTSSGTMARNLMKFELLVQAFSDLREIFKGLKNKIEQENSVIIKLDFDSYVQLILQKYQDSEDPILEMKNFMQQSSSLEHLDTQIEEFFKDNEIEKVPAKCLTSYDDAHTLVYNLFKEEQRRAKAEPYLVLKGEEQGCYQNVLLFAIRETDAKRILKEKKGPTPRAVVGIKEELGKPKFIYSKCKEKKNGKLYIGSQIFQQFEIVLWTAPFACDDEMQDAIGPVFLVGTDWDLYKLPEDKSRDTLLSKIKSNFTTNFIVQFFKNEEALPTSLPLSTVPYILTDTGVKSVWNKVKRPLSFFLPGNQIFNQALFQLSSTILQIYNHFNKLPSLSQEFKILLQKFKSLELNLSVLQIELTNVKAPLFISNLALALNLLSQFLQSVFKPNSSALVLSDFSLSNLPEIELTVLRIFSCFSEIFSEFQIFLPQDQKQPPHSCFKIVVEHDYPQDIYDTRRDIEECFFSAISQHLMHKLSQAQILNSTFTRWVKKNPSLVHLFTLPSYEAPILRLKHYCKSVIIDVSEIQDYPQQRLVHGLINLPTNLHNIANSLLMMQPLFGLKYLSILQLKIIISAKLRKDINYHAESNSLELSLVLTDPIKSDHIFEELAKSLHFKLPSPNGCAAFPQEFGCLIPSQRNQVNFVLLEFDQPLKRDMDLSVFFCSFDLNETQSLQFQRKSSSFVKVHLPSPATSRVFWVIIVKEEKEILLKKLFIRLTEDLENENPLLKSYHKRENCFLVGTDCFEVMKPVIIPEQLRGNHVDHRLASLRVYSPRSLHRRLVQPTEMRVDNKNTLVLLERAEQYEEAKGGQIHFTDLAGLRYLPFTNRRMQQEGCAQDRLYWPTGVKDAVVMTVTAEVPRQQKEEMKSVEVKEESKEEETKEPVQEKREKQGVELTRYNYEGTKGMKSYESEKKGKEKLALYDLKVSLEVAMNAFLSSELAYESLELGYIQKKKLKVLHQMLNGKPQQSALSIPRVATKLILHPKSLKGYPSSRAGQLRLEELEVGNLKVDSAHFLHLVLPNILVEAKVIQEENRVILEWTPPLRGVYQLFINQKLATLTHYQFVVLSSLNYQKPQFIQIPNIPKEITVAKNVAVSLRSRDREECIVMPEDYELAGLPLVKKEISAEVVNLGVNGQLKAEMRNKANQEQLGSFEFTVSNESKQFDSSDQMCLKFQFFHQTEEVEAEFTIAWNGATFYEHSFILKPKNFEERFQDFRREVRRVLRGNRDVQISRFHYIESIGLLPASVLKPTSISVKFNGEPAWDAGGPRKEFFSMLGEEFTRSKHPRFFEERKPLRYFPVSLNNNQDHRRQLRNFGTLLAIGVAQGFSLEFRCTPALHAAISGISKSSLLQDQDPTLAKNLEDMRHMDAETIESLELYFVHSDGAGKEVELIKGGKNKKLTKDNLAQYIRLVGEFHCYKCAEDEIQEIKKGMNLVFSSSKFANFSCEEMNRILSGDQTISKEFLKSKLYFYNEVSHTMRAFVKKWIDQASNHELQNFLQLITGSRNVSQSEMRNFRLNIDRSGETKRIPSASTCGNQLHLPPYQSYEELKTKLDMSVNLGAKYFAFG